MDVAGKGDGPAVTFVRDGVVRQIKPTLSLNRGRSRHKSLKNSFNQKQSLDDYLLPFAPQDARITRCGDKGAGMSQ